MAPKRYILTARPPATLPVPSPTVGSALRPKSFVLLVGDVWGVELAFARVFTRGEYVRLRRAGDARGPWWGRMRRDLRAKVAFGAWAPPPWVLDTDTQAWSTQLVRVPDEVVTSWVERRALLAFAQID